MNQNQNEISLYKEKLNTYLNLNVFADGLIKSNSAIGAAKYLCNDSKSILKFSRSFILPEGISKRVIAVTGMPKISSSSADVKHVKSLLSQTKDKLSILPGTGENTEIIHVPLTCPSSALKWHWFMEYPKGQAKLYSNAIGILSLRISKNLIHVKSRKSRKESLAILFRPLILSLLAFVSLCIFWEVPDKVVAPTIVETADRTAIRSKIDAQVLDFIPEFSQVKKGDLIATLDVREHINERNGLYKNLNEVSLKKNKAMQESLFDETQKTEYELLNLQFEKLNIQKQYLDEIIKNKHVYAPTDGTIKYLPEITMEGSGNIGVALTKGDTLCYIDDHKNTIFKINLPESDVSVMQSVKNVKVYLHSSPDTPIKAKITHIDDYPEVDKLSSSYVYPVKAVSLDRELAIGTTGNAHLEGEIVTFGYALCKKIIITFRSL